MGGSTVGQGPGRVVPSAGQDQLAGLSLHGAVALPDRSGRLPRAGSRFCKPICKRTIWHWNSSAGTEGHEGRFSPELDQTLKYQVTLVETVLSILENRCAKASDLQIENISGT